MAVRHVLKMGEALLAQPALPVTAFNTPELDALIADLFDTMHAHNGFGVTRAVQHIAHAQQGFGSVGVENGRAIHAGMYLKGDACRNVSAYQLSDYVVMGIFGGHHEVNARSACLLRQTCDECLYLFAGSHHQVGQFVDDDDDVGQMSHRLTGVAGTFRAVEQLAAPFGLDDFLIEFHHAGNAQFAHQLVAVIHLRHAPRKAIDGLLHVLDDWGDEVRNAFINRQLLHFGVNQQQAYIACFGAEKQRADCRVNAHGFTRTVHPRHQDMGHFGQIQHNRISDAILPQGHGQ